MTDLHAPYGRSSRLDQALRSLLQSAPELEAAAVVSFDGLPMASALPVGMDEDRVAAMSAALLSLGERAAQGLGRGDLSQVYVEGENGTVFLVSADEEAVLVAVAGKQAKVGLMLFEVRRAAQAVAEALLADDRDADLAEAAAEAAATAAAIAAHVPPPTAMDTTTADHAYAAEAGDLDLALVDQPVDDHATDSGPVMVPASNHSPGYVPGQNGHGDGAAWQQSEQGWS